MLRHYRRLWVVFVALLLSVPMLVHLLSPGTQTVAQSELRALAPPPEWPDNRRDWERFPGTVDEYLADHFGLRAPMIHANALITQGILRRGTDSVLIGRDDWLFYRLQDMVKQSAGLVLRKPMVQETARTIAQVQAALAAMKIRFLVAPPPNSSTIYSEYLPKWARNRGRPTEYDLLLSALKAHGVSTLDLRPPLRAASAQDRTYRQYDTHWNFRGALVGFNAVAVAANHADWQLDPQAVLATITATGGDLTRMLGIESDVSEDIPQLLLPDGRREVLESRPINAFTSTVEGRERPTVLVIGDSFTADFFSPMVLAHAGRYVWVQHQNCGFDWKWIEQFRPDEVWWMPTERLILCVPGRRPIGLPTVGAIVG